MNDLIRRSDAIEAIMRKPAWHASDGAYYHADDIRNALNELPSVQTKGKWKIEETDNVWGKGYMLTCSVCGDIFRVTENALPYEKYCRNCGAHMKGADDERKGD